MWLNGFFAAKVTSWVDPTWPLVHANWPWYYLRDIPRLVGTTRLDIHYFTSLFVHVIVAHKFIEPIIGPSNGRWNHRVRLSSSVHIMKVYRHGIRMSWDRSGALRKNGSDAFQCTCWTNMVGQRSRTQWYYRSYTPPPKGGTTSHRVQYIHIRDSLRDRLFTGTISPSALHDRYAMPSNAPPLPSDQEQKSHSARNTISVQVLCER